MEVKVGDIIYLTEDYPELEVVNYASPAGSGRISLKTAQYWTNQDVGVRVLNRGG